MRDDPGAAVRLGSPQRAYDPPRADPPSREQARAADRHDVHEPGRSTATRVGVGALGAIPKDSTSWAAVASTSWLGVPAAPTPAPESSALPASAASRGSGPASRSPSPRRSRRASSARPPPTPGAAARSAAGSCPHLDRRHRPRPRAPARADGRGEAHLPRPLLRHIPWPDLRQHVPGPDPGDAAQRHRRSGRVLEGFRGEAGGNRQTLRRGLRPVPLAL